jgi:hypothetical protein
LIVWALDGLAVKADDPAVRANDRSRMVGQRGEGSTMPRFAHGSIATPQQLHAAQRDLASRTADLDLGFAVAGPAALQDFDFLFPKLQDDPANLLPVSTETPKRLKDLGRTMQDPGGADPGDTDIPAIYTYFGQFVDHDITLEASSFTTAKLLAPSMAPLALDTIRQELKTPWSWTASMARRRPTTRPTATDCGWGGSHHSTAPRSPSCGQRGRATTTTCPASHEARTSATIALR